MSDPKIDLEKLKAVRDWSTDLADELERRTDLLPCKMKDQVGDCLHVQSRRYTLQEMKLNKMCKRCQVRWFARMAASGIQFVYDAKTERSVGGQPDFS